MAPRAVEVTPKKTLRVLHLFAGAKRKSSYGHSLKKAARRRGVKVEVQEIDLLRGGARHNLLLGAKRKHWLRAVKDGRYDMVVASPPCNTFSRARWANNNGPPPLRMKHCPRAFLG